MIVDWRGSPDLFKAAEFFSVGAYWKAMPPHRAGAKVLVGVSPTIIYTPEGVPSPISYNMALWTAMRNLGANTDMVVWTGNGGYSTHLFDLSRRGVLSAWLQVLQDELWWAHGFHVDYFTAMSWQFPELVDRDSIWDGVLGAFASELRRRGKLVIGQQFHLTNPLMNCNGAFVEQSPYAWGYTLDAHAAELARFRDMVARVDPREDLWVFEVRDYQRWPAAALDKVRAWATEQHVHLSLGRDANAIV